MFGKTLLKSAALAAGTLILLTGLVLAQTSPAPNGPGAERRDANRAIATECRTQIGESVRGPDRREAMRKCIEEKRQKAGLNGNGDRKVAREAAKANRKANMTACRDELKGQSLGKDERRTAMQGCMAKKDPQMGKQMACRQEATAKNLQQKTREFREFMRECRQRA